MIKKLLWQLREFRAPFPAMASWAYKFNCWLYDIQIKRHAEPIEHTLETTGWDYPNGIITFEHSTNLRGMMIEPLSLMVSQLRQIASMLRDKGVVLTRVSISYREIDNDLYNELLSGDSDVAFTGSDDRVLRNVSDPATELFYPKVVYIPPGSRDVQRGDCEPSGRSQD